MIQQDNKIGHLTLPINIYEIFKSLPHRYPFLLIDRILAVESGKKISVLKNVTINEPFFNGHFPEYPVMPGVLIIEAMAQASGVLDVLDNGKKDNEIGFLASINEAKFKRVVIPGDSLKIEVEIASARHGFIKYDARAFVEDNLAAEAKIMIARKVI